MSGEYRIERDSLGEIKVPAGVYWGAQSQRAMENFAIGSLKFHEILIQSLAVIKYAAAVANEELGLLKKDAASAIRQACTEIIEGKHKGQFTLSIFQTGSGTSTNMNVNEVVATRANEILGGKRITTAPVHPNDHVNMGQSSNDTFPSAIRMAAYIELQSEFLPALKHLHDAVSVKQQEYKDVIKTGRTHLMDAVPITFGQEMSGWAAQILLGISRIEKTLPGLAQLPLGGTAVGTGMNTHRRFPEKAIRVINEMTGIQFRRPLNNFEAQASMDIASELSGQLKTIAAGVMKISNDLRLMNSGPYAGFAEIRLPAVQPGSSIMPGKINPVVPEAARMVCARIMGNDTTITVSCSLGEFELNAMLPIIGYCLLESIEIFSHALRALADKAIQGMVVNTAGVQEALEKNPIIATALVPVLGYEKTAEIIKKALQEGKKIKEALRESGLLSEEEINARLDLKKMV